MKSIRLLLVSIFVLIFSAITAQAGAACKAGDAAQVLWKGSWYPAHVTKANGDQCFIHYDGYESSWDEWVGPDRIKIAAAFSEGDSLQVEWKGKWYPAHVLKVKGDQLFIHYDGYESSWDEWVGPARYKK